MLNKQSTAVCFPSFTNVGGIQKLLVSMSDDQAFGEWELHTLEDMGWNDDRQYRIKYWTPDIINSMRWLIRQPANAKHLIYIPQYCIDSDTPAEYVHTEMHSAVWWWDTLGCRDT